MGIAPNLPVDFGQAYPFGGPADKGAGELSNESDPSYPVRLEFDVYEVWYNEFDSASRDVRTSVTNLILQPGTQASKSRYAHCLLDLSYSMIFRSASNARSTGGSSRVNSPTSAASSPATRSPPLSVTRK